MGLLAQDLIWTLCLLLLKTSEVSTRVLSPHTDCFDHFVPEGATLTCECRANTTISNTTTTTIPNNNNNVDMVSFSWPGHSSSAVLILTNVQRHMNGTRYSCSMLQGDLNVTVTYQLQVVYGPFDDGTSIVGPDSFVTDGGRELNLTCQVLDVNPAPHISWAGVSCTRSEGASCIFTPQLREDGQRIVCIATNPEYSQDDTVVLSKATYILRLQYPPPKAPLIQTQWPGTVLHDGNAVSCTVSGGQPLVKNVVFNCSNPTLQDRADDVISTTVTSSLIVDTSKATADNMLCTCSAVWDPEPQLYSNVSEATFLLEYQAVITNFTVNSRTELNVVETDQSEVEFHCDVTGRPSAQVMVRKQGNNTSLGNTTDDGSLSNRRKVHTFKVAAARCEDMGIFTCEANSGFFDEGSTQSVRLTVSCGPRVHEQSWSPPLLMTGKAVELTLVAYPVPEYFHFFHILASSTNNFPEQEDLFQYQCQGQESARHLVMCGIERREIPDSYLGLYNVSISNAFGSFSFLLDVQEEGADDANISQATAVWMSAVAALTVLVILVVFIIFLTRKRRSRDVQCMRVAHRGSMAAHYDPDNDDDPSNSPVPFMEVRPISSDIQFKSTHPSHRPVPFSEILPALSSDGQHSDPGNAGAQVLPVSSEMEYHGPDPPASPLPLAQVIPYRYDGRPAPGLSVDHDPTQGRDSPANNEMPGDLREKDDLTDSMGNRPPNDTSCVPTLDTGLPGMKHSDYNLGYKHPRSDLHTGVEDAEHQESDTLNSQSSELQHLKLLSSSLYAPESHTGTFITKIYLPKQAVADLSGHRPTPVPPRQDNAEVLEYAQVNKSASKHTERPRLEQIFQQQETGDADPSPAPSPPRVYEDVIPAVMVATTEPQMTSQREGMSPIPAQRNFGSVASEGTTCEADSRKDEREMKWSGQQTGQDQGQHRGRRQLGQDQSQCQDRRQKGQDQGQDQGRQTGVSEISVHREDRAVSQQTTEQGSQHNVTVPHTGQHTPDLPLEQIAPSGIGRNRKKTTDICPVQTPGPAEGKGAGCRHSDPQADRPQPKKRSRKQLTKRRRRSDLQTEQEESKILETWDSDTL